MSEGLFFATNLYALETLVKPRFQILPRDIFLCFASFFWGDLLCIRKETE